MEWEVVYEVRVEVVEGAVLTRDQGIGAIGQVYLAGTQRGELRLEEGVGFGEEVTWPKPGETVKDDIGRGVQARASLREDVGFGRVGVER